MRQVITQYELTQASTLLSLSEGGGVAPSTPFIAKRGMHTCGVHTSPLPSFFWILPVPSRVARPPRAVSVLPLDLTALHSTTSRLYAVTVLFLFRSRLFFPLGVLFAILRQSSPCLVCHHQQHFLPFALLML